MKGLHTTPIIDAESENILWQELRDNKLGFTFKKQYSIKNYVVDFYCAQAKLAIELDGSIHRSLYTQKYDSYRTKYLQSLGVVELRFENKLVVSDIDVVLEKIKQYLPSPEVKSKGVNE